MTFHEIRLPHPPGCRVPTGPFDYGDKATIGLNLKRVGKSIEDSDLEKDYGIFAGVNVWNHKYIVMIKARNGGPSGKSEYFDTEADMKKEWQLD